VGNSSITDLTHGLNGWVTAA